MHMTGAELALVVAGLLAGEAQERLLRYAQDGAVHHIDEAGVNEYVREVTGDHFTAEDFRTLRGTVVAAETLARIGASTTQRARHDAEVQAAKAASDALQNTPAVARVLHRPARVRGLRGGAPARSHDLARLGATTACA